MEHGPQHFGKMATDIITGKKGRIIAYTQHMTGCNQYMITYSTNTDSVEAWSVDETRLKIHHDDQVKLEEKAIAKSPGANTSPMRVSRGPI